MLFFLVRADRDVRFAAGLEKSGHSQFAGKDVTVSSRLLRSLRLLHNRQLTVLVHPPQPPGAIIGRAGTSLRITVTACIREH